MTNEKQNFTHEELFEEIKKTITKDVQPYINSHGGDIEVVNFDEDHRLHVRLSGTCGHCPASKMTLYYVVEEALAEQFPEEDIEVIQVD